MAEEDPEKVVRFDENLYQENDDDIEDHFRRQFNKFNLLDLVDATEDGSNPSNSKDSDVESDQKTKLESSNSPTAKQMQVSKRKTRNRRKNKHRKKSYHNQEDSCVIEKDETKFVSKVGKSTLNSKHDLRIKLLKLDMRNLIPEVELKRMFGKSILKEDKSKDIKLRPISALRSRFVSGNIDPQIFSTNNGLTMELDDLFNIDQSKDRSTGASSATNDQQLAGNHTSNPIYFKFVHDKSYQLTQSMFVDAAHVGFSEGIIRNLDMSPGHVESILQVSDMIRTSDDYKTASVFIERALVILERAFHPRFNIASGDCRLTYKRPENRTFFITLFKHIIYCNRRGLRRTPLEYTKLLLSLDPDNDPLFASLFIDFFVLRSEDYDYMIDFAHKWQHLSKFPNIMFSLALSYFMKSRCTKTSQDQRGHNLELANKSLESALIRYPNFICKLLDACSAERDTKLKGCDYFDYSVYGTRYKSVPESVELLVALYVERCAMLWKSKLAFNWLESTTSMIVDKFADGQLCDSGQNLDYWSCFNGPVPRCLLRHIVLSDIKLKLPESATHTTFLDIDPFPPESIHSYSYGPRSNSFRYDRSAAIGFSGILRSMIPSFMLHHSEN